MADSHDLIQVYLDAPELGPNIEVGTLYRDTRTTALPVSFAYSADWLHQNPFMLDPELALYAGEQYPANNAPLFKIFLDSAPDRWGRILMDRREATLAQQARRSINTLFEMDYLLGVNDETRQGALRFKRPQGDFLDQSELPTPTVAQLAELQEIVRRIEEQGIESLPEYQQWLSLLVAPGSSLGGARPKSNFRDSDGTLWIAKFPAKDDLYDVGAWEYVVHQLARIAGIRVPPSRLLALGSETSHRIFCVQRFDRKKNARRMYASAMTMLNRQDGDHGSYLEIADLIQRFGYKENIDLDLQELYRRMLFNLMVGNRDDHLRNHGFVLTKNGWMLSSAFDMNPSIQKQAHTLTFDSANAMPDLGLAFNTWPNYRLSDYQARQILANVTQAVSQWEIVARQQHLSRAEVERMRSAFIT